MDLPGVFRRSAYMHHTGTSPPAGSHPGGRLRILTYNVHRCLGRDGRHAPERIARLIAGTGAQVVALQELDVNRMRSGDVDQALAIASLLRMRHHFHPAMRVVEELYGDAVLTLLPLRLVKAGPLPRVATRLPTEPRGALWVEVEVGGIPVQIVNAHLGLFPAERRAQAEALLGADWLGHPQCRDPAILLGDFNARPSSRAYGLLRHALNDASGRDGTRAKATFPSRWPLLRIDHIFTRGLVRVENVGVVAGADARQASDHLPLYADLSILPPRAPTGGPQAEAAGPLPVVEETL